MRNNIVHRRISMFIFKITFLDSSFGETHVVAPDFNKALELAKIDFEEEALESIENVALIGKALGAMDADGEYELY